MNVIFASGFLVPQHLLGKDYFRGTKNAFPDALFPDVPPLGTVPTRAQTLADQIAARFAAGPIHIIAHSMAGLDSRFLLSKNLLGLANPGRVASLSTISTPHWGSPVADLIAGPAPSELDPRRIIYETAVQLAIELGQTAGALSDLTSSFAAVFNRANPNVPGVKYFSYAGSVIESFFLNATHFYIQHTGARPEEKINDGMVSIASAAWTPLAEAPWPTDHLGEVGYNLSSPTLATTFDHNAAYARILSRA